MFGITRGAAASDVEDKDEDSSQRSALRFTFRGRALDAHALANTPPNLKLIDGLCLFADLTLFLFHDHLQLLCLQEATQKGFTLSAISGSRTHTLTTEYSALNAACLPLHHDRNSATERI